MASSVASQSESIVLSKVVHPGSAGLELKIAYRLVEENDLAIYLLRIKFIQTLLWGAQCFSGRVLDSRPRGRGIEPHWRHCVVSLSKTRLSLHSTGSTQEDPS